MGCLNGLHAYDCGAERTTWRPGGSWALHKTEGVLNDMYVDSCESSNSLQSKCDCLLDWTYAQHVSLRLLKDPFNMALHSHLCLVYWHSPCRPCFGCSINSAGHGLESAHISNLQHDMQCFSGCGCCSRNTVKLLIARSDKLNIRKLG